MKIIKKDINYDFGYIKIKPTLNNIFITLTDYDGNVLLTKHAGLLNFKGSKKRTPYVAGQVMKELLSDIEKFNIKIKSLILQIHGYVKGSAMYNVMRQFDSLNVNNLFYIEQLKIRTHNGLRLKKKRRL